MFGILDEEGSKCNELLQAAKTKNVLNEQTDGQIPEALLGVQQCIFNYGQNQIDKSLAQELWDILVFVSYVMLLAISCIKYMNCRTAII